MGLDETYARIEDKYYSFLDGLEKSGIPVYSVVDPIEHAGIPSLPLLVGLIILIIGLIWYSLSGPGIINTGELELAVTSNGLPVDGATVKVVRSEDNEFIDSAEVVNGKATLSGIPENEQIKIIVTKPNCVDWQDDLYLSDGLPSIELQCGDEPPISGCFQITEGMETTLLQNEDGEIPDSCEVRIYPSNDITSYISHDWIVLDGMLHVSSPSDDCPETTDTVKILCDKGSYNNTIQGLLDEIALSNTLTLEGGEEETEEEQEAEDVRAMKIHVETKTGASLKDIIVKAVDASGTPLTIDYTNVEIEGTTNTEGYTQLVLPDGQYFYIAAEDPKGVYGDYFDEDEKYMANLDQTTETINIKMDFGKGTEIKIKESGTQTPVSGATVRVSDSNGKNVGYPKITDSSGKVNFVLFSNQQYDISVTHRMYEPGNQTISGGENATVYMTPVDITKTGNLVIKTIKSHGTKDAMEGVMIRLMKGDEIYAESVTGSSGQATITNILEGNYDIKLLAPGGTNYQTGPNVQVNAQNTTELTIEVNPEQVTLTVMTYVELEEDKKVRKKNVDVELWDAEYEEKIAEMTSDNTRKVQFTIDKCTEVYFVLSYTETEGPYAGTKYGPLTSSPKEYCNSKEIRDLVLKEKPEDTKISLDVVSLAGDKVDGLEAGTNYYALLSVNLPEYTRENTYEQVTVEFFTGDTGRLSNTDQTPVTIDNINLNDLAVQDPYISSIEKADEYNYGGTPTLNEEGQSKYLKINIARYTEGTYVARIPIYVRELAKQGNTRLSYRAKWIAPTGDVVTSMDNKWSEKIIPIVPHGTPQYYDLDTENSLHFYAYKSWLTATKHGDPITDEKITNNSYFYLHLNATARDDYQQWTVPLETIPGIAEIVSYEGTIYRENAETKITATPFEGSEVVNTLGLYKINKDDTLNLIITFRATAPGSASMIVFNDARHPMSFEVSEIPALEKETPISGVTASLTAQSFFEKGLDYDQNYWATYDIREEVLPTNNKKFKLMFNLKNDGLNNSKQAKMLLNAKDSSLKFEKVEIGGSEQAGSGTYIEEIDFLIPSNGIDIEITGTGTTQQKGELEITIYEASTLRPEEPWYTFEYGRVDYSADIKTYEDGSIQSTPTENADEVGVWLYKETNEGEEQLGGGIEKDEQVKIQYSGGKGYAHLEEEGPYFKYVVPSYEPLKGTLKATVESEKFGRIIEEEDIEYLVFTPSEPNVNAFTELSLLNKQEKSYTVMVTSYYEEELSMDISKMERDGWEITQETTIQRLRTGTESVYMDLETIKEAESVTIPTKGRVKITITAKPVEVKCRYEGNVLLELSVNKMREPFVYAFTMSCTDILNMSTPDYQGLKDRLVMRSNIKPSETTKDNCLSIGGEDDTKNIAYLCDSEQFGTAILDAARDLFNDPYSVKYSYYYSLGIDEVNFGTLSDTLKAHEKEDGVQIAHVYSKESSAKETETKDIVMEGSIGCGVTKITLEKFNYDEDIKVIVGETDTDVSWCDRGNNSYLIGLLNYDQSIRPQSGKYYSFDQDGQNERIIEAIQLAKTKGNDVDNTQLFSYDSEGETFNADAIVNAPSRKGGSPESYIRYKDCEKSSTADCPIFAINAFKWVDEPIIGYFNIDLKDHVTLGMIYDKEQISTEGEANLLDRYRSMFITRLMQYTISNDLDYGWQIKTPLNEGMIYAPTKDNGPAVVDLSPVILNVTLYGIDENGVINTDITGTEKINIYVNITEKDKAHDDMQEPAYCYVGNMKPDGTIEDLVQTDDFHEKAGKWKYSLDITDWELPGLDGKKEVAVYCVDQGGVTSMIYVDSIRLDRSGMQLVGEFPERISMYGPMLEKSNFPDFVVRSKYKKTDHCWITLEDKPTEGEMADGEPADYPEIPPGTNICTNNKNDQPVADIGTIPESQHVDDGCCSMIEELEGSGTEKYFNNYMQKFDCNSPAIETIGTDVKAKIWCEDTYGNEKIVANFSLYRWDSDAPIFALPYDFTFSVNTTYDNGQRTSNKGGTGLLFNEKLIWEETSAANGYPTTWHALNSDPTKNIESGTGILKDRENANKAEIYSHRDLEGYYEFGFEKKTETMYNLSFIVSDNDGIESCTASTRPGETDMYPSSCTFSQQTTPEKRVASCQIELLEKNNPIEVTCEDTIGKRSTQQVTITLDEEGPEILKETIETSKYGNINEAGKRVRAPEITFTVKDDYSTPVYCNISIPPAEVYKKNGYEFFTTHYYCDITPTEGTTATANCYSPDFSVLVVNLDPDDWRFECNDSLGNYRTQEAYQPEGIKDAPPISQMKEDILRLCEAIRYNRNEQYVYDLGVSDDLGANGSVAVKDGGQIDRDGFIFEAYYKEGGSTTRKEITEYMKQLNDDGVPRAASCASQAACGTTIDLVLKYITAGAGSKVLNEGVAEANEKAQKGLLQRIFKELYEKVARKTNKQVTKELNEDLVLSVARQDSFAKFATRVDSSAASDLAKNFGKSGADKTYGQLAKKVGMTKAKELPTLLKTNTKAAKESAGRILYWAAEDSPAARKVMMKGFDPTGYLKYTTTMDTFAMEITKSGISKWVTRMALIDIFSRRIYFLAGMKSADMRGIEETLDSRFPGDLTEDDCDTSYDLTASLLSQADALPLVGDYVKAFTPDPFQTTTCSNEKLEGGKAYVIHVRGEQVNLNAEGMPAWAQVMGTCFDSCADYQCSVTIVEEE